MSQEDSPLGFDAVVDFDMSTGQFVTSSFADKLAQIRELRSIEGLEAAELVLKSYHCLAGMPTYWSWLVRGEMSAVELNPSVDELLLASWTKIYTIARLMEEDLLCSAKLTTARERRNRRHATFT
eukprot:4306926-Amphidinium_carterae.1